MFIDDIAAQDDDIRLLIADAPDQLTKRAGIRRRRIMQVAESGDAQILIELFIFDRDPCRMDITGVGHPA